MMNNKDLALMTTRLHVPLIIRDMMEHSQGYAKDIDYNLHDIISDMQPDAAILSIALGVQYICAKLPKESFVPSLEVACDRIIEDYGPLWLAHVNDQEIDNVYLIDLLTHLPEDFDTLNEFMDLVMAYVPEDSMAYKILDILSTQASAHNLIAETFIEAIEAHYQEEMKALNMPQSFAGNDNVVAFPGCAARHN